MEMQPNQAPQAGAQQSQQSQQSQSQQPPQDKQSGNDASKDLARRAQEAIYTDQKVFESLINALQNKGQEPTKTIGMAAVAIIDKMEESVGEQTVETLQEVGQVVVRELMELAGKAGVLENQDVETFKEALSYAYRDWMREHKDRVDPNVINQAVQSEAGQAYIKQRGAGQQAQPQQPAPAQNVEGGLLNGAMQ